MNKKTQGLASILFVMIIWGSSFAVTRLAVQQIPPLTFAFMRFAVAGLVYLPVLLIKQRSLPAGFFRLLPWKILFAMGLTGITAYFLFFNLSLTSLPASAGAMIQGFIPVAIAGFAAIFLKERLSARQLAGIVLSVAGVLCIGLLADQTGEQSSGARGTALMIVAVFCWAGYTILSKKVAQIHPLMITIVTTYIGTALLVPLVIYENYGKGFPAISSHSWLSILYLGLLGSAIGYFLYSKALESLSAVMVGNFINLDPVIGLVIAILFLPERINAAQIGGGLLVLAGIVLSTTGQKKLVTVNPGTAGTNGAAE